jgi:hypothetical protein
MWDNGIRLPTHAIIEITQSSHAMTRECAQDIVESRDAKKQSGGNMLMHERSEFH